MIGDENPIDCRIVVRDSSTGLHTDVLITWRGAHYLTRHAHVVNDTPIGRANEIALFKRQHRIR